MLSWLLSGKGKSLSPEDSYLPLVAFLPLLLVVFSTRILFFRAESRTLTEPLAIATEMIFTMDRNDHESASGPRRCISPCSAIAEQPPPPNSPQMIPRLQLCQQQQHKDDKERDRDYESSRHYRDDKDVRRRKRTKSDFGDCDEPLDEPPKKKEHIGPQYDPPRKKRESQDKIDDCAAKRPRYESKLDDIEVDEREEQMHGSPNQASNSNNPADDDQETMNQFQPQNHDAMAELLNQRRRLQEPQMQRRQWLEQQRQQREQPQQELRMQLRQWLEQQPQQEQRQEQRQRQAQRQQHEQWQQQKQQWQQKLQQLLEQRRQQEQQEKQEKLWLQELQLLRQQQLDQQKLEQQQREQQLRRKRLERQQLERKLLLEQLQRERLWREQLERQQLGLQQLQQQQLELQQQQIDGSPNQASNSNNPADNDQDTGPPMNPNGNAITTIIQDTQIGDIGRDFLCGNTCNNIQIDGKGFFVASAAVSILLTLPSGAFKSSIHERIHINLCHRTPINLRC
ncbi:hypothetical protein C8J56DRAFT_900503 [Mycena floridula]|nr:hypothetical protein C8J56DRAFT_900503 [Mycena floridula]